LAAGFDPAHRLQYRLLALTNYAHRVNAFPERHGHWGRDAALWLGRCAGRLGLAELGRLVGNLDSAVVSKAVARLDQGTRSNTQLRPQLVSLVCCG